MIEEYTVGDDRELDMRLARYDVEGSLAHIAMLETIGLLTAEELEKLTAGLKEIAAEIEAGRFEIEPGTEDVHSQVELMRARKYTRGVRATIRSSWTSNCSCATNCGRWPTP